MVLIKRRVWEGKRKGGQLVDHPCRGQCLAADSASVRSIIQVGVRCSGFRRTKLAAPQREAAVRAASRRMGGLNPSRDDLCLLLWEITVAWSDSGYPLGPDVYSMLDNN